MQILGRRTPIDDVALNARVDEALTELREQLAGEGAQNDYLQERLAELELALDDVGWARLSMETDWEFSRDGIDRIVALSRLNTLKNPLIRRGVHLKADYVFGQGVEISARDDEINVEVIQPFLDDPGNAKTLFSDVALPAKDRALTTDGNLVLLLFPNELTGHVSVRSINIDEIRDVVVNPDDRTEPWFYLRRWTERRFQSAGTSLGFLTVSREAWYPDWRYRPRIRPESIDRIQVRWASPLYHVSLGGLDGMRFGVPETYAAIDWARAYKLFLEDWATIVRSLSRFAWKLTGTKNPSAAAARLGATAPAGSPETNPSPVAGAVFTSKTADLTPIQKSGATVASEDGVWLAKMVSAALGLPYTMLMGDSDQGNWATAKTLDRPTELQMIGRQRVHAEMIRDLCNYAIDWAIRAPGGPLAGTEERGPDGRARMVVPDVKVDGETVSGAERRTVDVVFPPILEDDVKARVDAIMVAEGSELIDPAVILRLLLTALGVDDVDELVAALPERLEQRQRELGQLAVDRARHGLDPAEPLGDDEDED